MQGDSPQGAQLLIVHPLISSGVRLIRRHGLQGVKSSVTGSGSQPACKRRLLWILGEVGEVRLLTSPLFYLLHPELVTAIIARNLTIFYTRLLPIDIFGANTKYIFRVKSCVRVLLQKHTLTSFQRMALSPYFDCIDLLLRSKTTSHTHNTSIV